MFTGIDRKQVSILTRFTLKSEWRSASLRSLNRRRKLSKGWAYWTAIIYLLSGSFLIRLFSGNLGGGEYVVAASAVMLFISFITASNIFLSFGTGFLSPDEAQIISPLPVSSETFFFSRLTVLLCYTTVITFLIAVGPVVGLLFYFRLGFIPCFMLMISELLSNIAAAMAVIVIYGIVLVKMPRARLTKMIGYVQFIGTFATMLTLVILPRIQRQIDFHSYTLDAKPLLGLIPAFWFGSLAGLANGVTALTSVVLAAASLVFLGVLAAVSHIYLAKHYQTDVSDLALSSVTLTKQAQPKSSITNADGVQQVLSSERTFFQTFLTLFRSYEARAVLMLLRAQFRFDPKFRMSLIATLPLTFMYLAIALLQGGIHDPFVSNLRTVMSAQFIYLVALFMPMLVMQSVSQSENYKAAWIFFAAPLDRSRLLLAVRNTLIVWVIVPYMIVLAIVFSFFMPVYHAVMHVLVLAAMAGFIFQVFIMISPRMPFAQRRRPNRSNVAAIFGMSIFGILPFVLLGVEIYFGYRTPFNFWSSFVLIVTLSILLEQIVRSRVRKKLEREEFEG